MAIADAGLTMSVRDDPTFRVSTTDEPSGETLAVALPQLGMANLTALDFLVQHNEAEEIGYVDTEDLPAMTPIQDGTPRRHTRLFDLPSLDLTILLGELFVPVWAAGGFSEALSAWTVDQPPREIVILHGVPFPHAETEHSVFTVTTSDFEERRLGDTPYEPLRGGFFDGIPGELLDRNLDEGDPSVAALVTPAHPPGPDVEAALRLLEAFEAIFELELDLSELEAAAVQTREYYDELAQRFQTLQNSDTNTGSRDYPIDRMYM
jgi:uncharacterized protein